MVYQVSMAKVHFFKRYKNHFEKLLCKFALLGVACRMKLQHNNSAEIKLS